MRINIEISDELMDKVHETYPDKSTQETVEEALSLYVAFRSQNQLSEFWGNIEFDPKI